MKRSCNKAFMFVMIFYGCLSQGADAQIYSTTKSGAWNDATVWDLGTIPSSADTVEIFHKITFAGNATVGTTGVLHIDAVGSLSFDQIENNNIISNNGILLGKVFDNQPGAKFRNNGFVLLEELDNAQDAIVGNYGVIKLQNRLRNTGTVVVQETLSVNGLISNSDTLKILENAQVATNKFDNNNTGILSICGIIGMGVASDDNSGTADNAIFTNDGKIIGCEGGVYAGEDNTQVINNGEIEGIVFLCLGANSTYVNNNNAVLADFVLNCCFLLRAEAGPDRKICKGENVTIGGTPTAFGGAEPYVYTWTSPAGVVADAAGINPIVSPGVETQYFVSVLDADGCVAIDSVTLFPTDKVIARAGPVVNICEGESVRLGGSPSALCGQPGYIVSWSPAASLDDPSAENPLASPTETTLYILTVTDSSGDVDRDTTAVFVDPRPVDANAGPDQTICTVSTTLQGNAPSFGSGRWSVVSGTANIVDEFDPGTEVNGLIRGDTIILKWEINNGNCPPSEDEVIIRVLPQAALNISDRQLCLGDSVQLLATGGTSYAWSPDTGLSNAGISNPVATPDVNTTYVVTISNPGCPDVRLQATLTVNPNPVIEVSNDTTILAGESVQLFARGGDLFSWVPGTGLDNVNLPDPVATPRETTTYTVTVENEFGCPAEGMVTVNVNDRYQIFVPQMFTPNGDGSNDRLHVNTIGIETLTFKIFDRHGKLIFETNDGTVGWDGKFNGNIQNIDTYVYLVMAKTYGNQDVTEKGTFQLVR